MSATAPAPEQASQTAPAVSVGSTDSKPIVPPVTADEYSKGFGAGIVKAKSEQATEFDRLKAEVTATKAKLAKFENAGKTPEELLERLTTTERQRDDALTQVQAFSQRRLEDTKARASKLPAEYQPLILRKLEAGNLEDATADLADYENIVAKRPAQPNPNAVPNESLKIPMAEYDALMKAGNAVGLKAFEKKFGANALNMAIRNRRAGR